MLVERLLARAAGECGGPIRTISFNVDQIAASDVQRQHRLAIAWRLGVLGLTWDEHTELELRTQEGGGLHSIGLPQAVIWMLATQALEEEEDLQLGYIRGDDFAYSSAHFVQAFDAFRASSRRTGNLYFPLINRRKTDVLRCLQEFDLRELCWWCQHPSAEPCGNCTSCVAHETARWQLERWPAET